MERSKLLSIWPHTRTPATFGYLQRHNHPAIMHVEDLDLLLPNQSAFETLHQLDQLSGHEADERVLLITETRQPQFLDV